jgi:hypothetical protein
MEVRRKKRRVDSEDEQDSTASREHQRPPRRYDSEDDSDTDGEKGKGMIQTRKRREIRKS